MCASDRPVDPDDAAVGTAGGNGGAPIEGIAPPSDIEMMLQVQESDAEAFACLVARYRARLSRFFSSLGAPPDVADDLLQETFVRLWQARERYRPEARFSTYLMEIARNLWLNARDRALRAPAQVSLDEDTRRPDALALALADSRADPEAVVLARERRRRIDAAIDTLPQKQQIVFVLCHFEGMRYREIAASLGIPEGTVRYRMHEAVHALRRMLDGLLEGE
ncbi:MAG: sigma-70 family RNA polymerase sigma factor [Armatimonadetes bacterium]|nr:sigma-70 family RNA polymerase sigma factor [Armatimonadota bacterium]